MIYEMRKVGLHGSIIRLDHAQLAMPAGRDDDGRVFCQELLGIPEVAKPPHPRGDEMIRIFSAPHVSDWHLPDIPIKLTDFRLWR